MKLTQRKDALRNIGKQKVSYLSIVIIALMGVTAFLGICYAAAAMKVNGSKAYNELDFRDVEVISTHLLTEEDLAALKNTAGVLDVEPLWQTGANAYGGGARESAVVITVTERLNRPNVREGRLPQNPSECAIERSLAEKMGLQVGDTMEWLEMTDATGQFFLSPDNLLITGIITSPDHINRNVPDVPYVLVTRDAFDHEALDGCCMKALVAVERASNANRFDAAYNDAVTQVSDRIEGLAPAQIALRDERLQAQAQEQIDEIIAALEEAKQALADGRSQLDEGWQLRAGAPGRQDPAGRQRAAAGGSGAATERGPGTAGRRQGPARSGRTGPVGGREGAHLRRDPIEERLEHPGGGQGHRPRHRARGRGDGRGRGLLRLDRLG